VELTPIWAGEPWSRVTVVIARFPLEPKHFWTVGSLVQGFRKRRGVAMILPSARDVFLTITIASSTLLIEIAVFILVGMI
jgi:hypothetical protein